jgi:adenosyl cobinamide kinase/adenosyl cobinamide phosphate guanylyltransferase
LGVSLQAQYYQLKINTTGVSFDDEPVQIINLHKDKQETAWEKWVADNINRRISKHELT